MLLLASHLGHISVTGVEKLASSHLMAAAWAYRVFVILRVSVTRPPGLQVPQHFSIVIILSGAGVCLTPGAPPSGYVYAATCRAALRVQGVTHRLSPRRPDTQSVHPPRRCSAAWSQSRIWTNLSGLRYQQRRYMPPVRYGSQDALLFRGPPGGGVLTGLHSETS